MGCLQKYFEQKTYPNVVENLNKNDFFEEINKFKL